MKRATKFFFVIAMAFITQTEGGVICFSGNGFGGCDAGCASKPGFRNGVCRPGYLGYYYCSCTSEVDGSLVPICTGVGGFEACQKGCQVAGDFEAVCETSINFCNCIPRKENDTPALVALNLSI